jgi:hypothetical protein
MSPIESRSSQTSLMRTQEDYIMLNANVNATNMVNNKEIGTKRDPIQNNKGYADYEVKRQHQKDNLQYLQANEQKNWFGDELDFHEKWISGEYNETFRVGAVNINGISKYVNWIEWDIIVKTMSRLQLDMFGLTGPNINFDNKKIELRLRDIAKATDRNIQLSTSCSNQLNHTDKKMGGTMSILAGRWAGRKTDVDSDKKGCWSSITLQGKKGRKITLITAYRVCQQKGGEGNTVYHQQQLDFEEEGKRHVNLRKLFCSDLAQYVRSLHTNNHIVILMGDFNEDLNTDGGQINTMLRDCNLCNVFHCTQGLDITLPSTYVRGKNA